MIGFPHSGNAVSTNRPKEGRFRMRSKNQLQETSGGESAGLSRDTQQFPVNMGSVNASCSHKNRKSRPISGPSYSSAKDLEYKGT